MEVIWDLHRTCYEGAGQSLPMQGDLVGLQGSPMFLLWQASLWAERRTSEYVSDLERLKIPHRQGIHEELMEVWDEKVIERY